MSEQRIMLAETVNRLFGELMVDGIPSDGGGFLADGWARVEELGLPDLFRPEDAGGFGGGWADAFEVFRALGRHALPLPLGETLVARKLLQEAGIEPPTGVMAIAACGDGAAESPGNDTGPLASGALVDVPWGRAAQWLVVAAAVDGRRQLLLIPADRCAVVREGINEAGEPRDCMTFTAASVDASATSESCPRNLLAYAALLRSGQVAGALEACLELTIDYVSQREQFGRPLGRFQALQHQVARLAEEAAAVKCAAEAASRCADKGEALFEIAAAKLRANRAVGEATSIAHQSHGAIGFTAEHRLHYWTQRLWSWRSEYGNDRYWSNRLGRLVLGEGAANFWPNLTARGDR